MDTLLTIVAINVCSAGILAGAVALAARFVRRPEVVHLLWLVVLLKLISPPLLELAVLPGPLAELLATQPTPTVPSGPFAIDAAAATPHPVGTRTPEAASAVLPGVVALRLGLTVWLAGALTVIGLALFRGRRFFESLRRGAVPAPDSLVRRTAQLAGRIGLRRAPDIGLVGARLSPLLWFVPGDLRLVLPRDLLARLAPAERDTLIVHELAHLRRRDHWLRYVELLVLAAFWWNPVVWWTRARMRQAEERSCDDWVLRVLPGHSADYAEGLLKTVEFLSEGSAAVPAVASGVGRVRDLETRLTMILNHRTRRLLGWPARSALALSAVGLLAIFPSWGERGPVEDRGGSEAVRETEQDLRSLEREEIELERRMRELQTRRLEVETELAERYAERERVELLEEVARLESRGESAAAAELRARVDQRERERELEMKARELQQRHLDQARALEYEARSLQLDAERLAAEGDSIAAGEARLRALEYETQLGRSRLEVEAQERALQAEILQHQADAARDEYERYVDREEAERLTEGELEEIDAQLDNLRLQMDKARADDRHAELERLEATYQKLLMELEMRLAR